MQWEAEKEKKKDKALRMLERKKQEIQLWMGNKCVSGELKKKIMAEIEGDYKGADLDDIFSILRESTKISLMSFLCMEMLKVCS